MADLYQADTDVMLRELTDRQRIWDCLLCYTRGLDRLDRELLLSGFHADARIQTGSFSGEPRSFADWVLGHHRDNQVQTQHIMTNHYCQLHGDEAHTETYVAYYGNNPGQQDEFAVGRYLDRLQRFASGWLITDRVCTTEGTTNFDKNGLLERMILVPDSLAAPARDRSDPAYRRPLRIPR
ncbi:nuclear transport factor 2 family protein [Pseudomaricurvus sp. HS19]|uniref:nuclear transport factor 2 family protein n=1 Tax=Pseudomaricurvus sp. HS19 TaxID=2692626 RepID=UPI00136A3437|nr:nuclear transport factor 2 family protein [Pseudomaricurvus sp. HS19]MYM62914.1 nuclear transport factor 2 family protein [Pseudomaricurvus sp. HS19]